MSSARTAEARRISGGSFGQGNRAAAQCRLYARRPSSVASPSPFVLKGKTSPATPVRDIMERHVVIAQPEQSVDQCMAVMSEKRVRHLPVFEGEKPIGIVSIGDLVKSIIGDQKFMIIQLEHYINGERAIVDG
jgi:hypothetical protein